MKATMEKCSYELFIQFNNNGFFTKDYSSLYEAKNQLRSQEYNGNVKCYYITRHNKSWTFQEILEEKD